MTIRLLVVSRIHKRITAIRIIDAVDAAAMKIPLMAVFNVTFNGSDNLNALIKTNPICKAVANSNRIVEICPGRIDVLICSALKTDVISKSGDALDGPAIVSINLELFHRVVGEHSFRFDNIVRLDLVSKKKIK